MAYSTCPRCHTLHRHPTGRETVHCASCPVQFDPKSGEVLDVVEGRRTVQP